MFDLAIISKSFFRIGESYSDLTPTIIVLKREHCQKYVLV